METQNYLWSFFVTDTTNQLEVFCPNINKAPGISDMILIPAIQSGPHTIVLTMATQSGNAPQMLPFDINNKNQKFFIGSFNSPGSFNYVRIGSPTGNDLWLDRIGQGALTSWKYNATGNNQDWKIIRYDGCFYQILAVDESCYLAVDDTGSTVGIYKK